MHLVPLLLPSLLTTITPLITLTLPPPTTAWAFAYTNQTGSTRYIHGYESDVRKCTPADIAQGKPFDFDSQGDKVCVSIFRDESCTNSAGYACHTQVRNASDNFAAYSIYPREEEDAGGGGLSGGAIAGIVVGVVAACAGAGGVFGLVWWRRRKRRAAGAGQGGGEDGDGGEEEEAGVEDNDGSVVGLKQGGAKRESGESDARGHTGYGDGDGDVRPAELMGDAGLSEMSDSHRVVELGDNDAGVGRRPLTKIAELG